MTQHPDTTNKTSITTALIFLFACCAASNTTDGESISSEVIEYRSIRIDVGETHYYNNKIFIDAVSVNDDTYASNVIDIHVSDLIYTWQESILGKPNASCDSSNKNHALNLGPDSFVEIGFNTPIYSGDRIKVYMLDGKRCRSNELFVYAIDLTGSMVKICTIEETGTCVVP